MARKLGEFSNVKNWIESLGLLWVLPIFYNSNSAFYWTNLYLNLLKKIEGFNIFFCGKRGKLARFLIRTLRLFFLRMEKEFSILKDLVIQSIFSTKLMEAFKINIKIRFIFYINEHIAFISLYKSRYKFYKNFIIRVELYVLFRFHMEEGNTLRIWRIIWIIENSNLQVIRKRMWKLISRFLKKKREKYDF